MIVTIIIFILLSIIFSVIDYKKTERKKKSIYFYISKVLLYFSIVMILKVTKPTYGEAFISAVIFAIIYIKATSFAIKLFK